MSLPTLLPTTTLLLLLLLTPIHTFPLLPTTLRPPQLSPPPFAFPNKPPSPQALTAWIYYMRERSCLSTPSLIAILTPLNKSGVTGTVKFTTIYKKQVNRCMVKVSARVEGLGDGKKHGFHVHEFGDLSSEDGKAMGGHFNPRNVSHGLLGAKKRHVGDMGNLGGNGGGVGVYERENDLVAVSGIVGRGVVVHEVVDDGGQPTGNSGSRIAQGVIGYALVPKDK